MKLDESNCPPLGDEEAAKLEALVRRGRVRTMGPETSKRIADRLAASGAFSQRPPPKTGRVPRSLKGVTIAAVALLGLGAAVFAWTRRPDAAGQGPSIDRGREPFEGVVAPAPPRASSVAVDDLPSRGATAPLAIPSVAIATTPPPVANSASRGPRPPASAHAAAKPSADPPPIAPDEFALIRRAQAALASDPVRAIAIADEHERAFPTGEFVQERELTAIDALVRLGRKAEAMRRANALVARFPRTPYAGRLERALGEPLPAARSPKSGR